MTDRTHADTSMLIQQEVIERYQLHKLDIHRSDWCGISVQVSMSKSPPPPSCQTLRETRRTATLLLNLFIKTHDDAATTAPTLNMDPPGSNQNCSGRCWRHQELVFRLPPHHAQYSSTDSLKLNDGKRVVAARHVFDSHLVDFEVETIVELQSFLLKGQVIQEIVETEASGYTIDFTSVKLKFCQQLESCHVPWSYVSNTTSLDWRFSTNSYATSSYDQNHPALSECHRSFHIYPRSISPEEDIKGIVIRYRATKKFPHVDGMPPDGSYGLVLLPMLIKWTVLQSRVEYTSSASLLITRPIPDRTMPYNVLTMVR